MFDANRFIGRPELIVAGLILALALLLWAGRRLRRADRPDEPLSRIAMLIGLGWSSESVWELTGRIEQFPTQLRLLLFFVLEFLLIISMVRAARHVREHGWPGRAGTTAWTIAAAMAAVGAGVSHSLAEALLRAAIPLLLTKQWWDGLVGDRQRPDWATSWRLTPRRILLRLGLIEPGERDVQTVHRARLTARLVRLEFSRRHGSGWWWSPERTARKLARLSLDADDEIIADVRARVGRAEWFKKTAEPEPEHTQRRGMTAEMAAALRTARVRHRRSLRKVRVTQPHECVTPAQPAREDTRAPHDVEQAIRAIKAAAPGLSQRRIAVLAATSERTVRRVLRRTSAPEPAQKINGRDLETTPQ